MTPLQMVKPRGEARHHADEPRDQFAGPWFSAKTAAAYIPCKSVKAWYEWRRRHGIIPRNNGSVAKADLDRALRTRKARRVMAAASLANLHKRHVHSGKSRVGQTSTTTALKSVAKRDAQESAR